jgi:hypothetical protein
MYKQSAWVGGIAALISCGCIVIPFFIALGSAVGFTEKSSIGSLDAYPIILGVLALAGLSIFSLKRKRALNRQGLIKFKGSIMLSITIFIIVNVSMIVIFMISSGGL